MLTLVDMATTTVGEQPFSRIVETRKTTSWAIGVPIAIFVVAAVALIVYFAAKGTQAREQLAQAQQGTQQQQQQLTQVQQKLSSIDAELARLRDAGRTTVILQAPAATGKKAKASSSSWGAATWGEQTDGKSWMRLNAYGLAAVPAGKTYDMWFVSATGDSVLVGKLDPNTDGTAFLEGKDLPAVDQGKSLLVALDDEKAKTPGQVVFQAALPKLTPSQHAAASEQANAGAGQNAAKDTSAQSTADASKGADAQQAAGAQDKDAQKGSSAPAAQGKQAPPKKR